MYRGIKFRRAFSRIGSLRALTKAPFMALTATASSDMQAQIEKSLNLSTPVIISLSLNRPNIYYSVSTIQSKNVSINTLWRDIAIIIILLQRDLAGIVSILGAGACPKTIVYTLTKNTACKVYDMLSQAARESLGLYHASLTKETKCQTHEKFKNGSIRCLVSTIAFGMVSQLFCTCNNYIYITARLGGQYGGIFSSRLAVLARAQRGTIQKPRTEYSPVLPDPKECSNRFIVCLTHSSATCACSRLILACSYFKIHGQTLTGNNRKLIQACLLLVSASYL